MTREQTQTPCEKKGYKVGDSFEVVVDCDGFTKGSIVELYRDDGTRLPLFKLLEGESFYYRCGGKSGAYTDLDNVIKLEEPSHNKYVRVIHGVEVDVYDILKAYEVTCPATQHAIKKLLMPGQRGHKNKADDLEEAHAAIQRAIELEVF